MNIGAFACSCGGSCDIDLERARDGVRDVDVVASSSLLCQDGLDAMEHVIDQYDLDQVVATATDDGCKSRIRERATEAGLHPDATAFVDHREGSAWVHDRDEATDKTARVINATAAGVREASGERRVSREAGDRVAVVGDPETAAALADTADVTLVANGREFAGADLDLDDVTLRRGGVASVEGEYGEFTLSLRSRVTADCISCMECVERGPDDMVTARPVDIHPEAPRGEWTDCCPTDAIDMDGETTTLDADQVVWPGADRRERGGRIGFYTTSDAGTVAAVESLLGGVEKPRFIDLEMDVCASGASSQQGCTECSDACPHGAVARPAVDEVEIDPVACQNCGACTSACPTGAVSLREPSNRRLAREVEALVDEDTDDGGSWFGRGDDGIETPVVAFTCSERARDRLREYGRAAAAGAEGGYPPILPVSVNCTDTVGSAHVLHALAAGAEGVAIVGCGESCLHSGPDPKAALVERLNRATRDLGLGDRTTFLAPGPDPARFREELETFVGGLDPSPVPRGEHEATGRIEAERPNPDFDTHGWALESVRAIVQHAEPERDVIRGLTAFGRMEVSEACNLTPTCSNLCPTDAIRRTTDADLEFNHEQCVNCGLCEQGCPETAITMKDGLDLSLLPERNDGEAWHTVHDGEMQECVRCGKAFASAGTIEKVRGEVGDRVTGIAPEADHDIFEYCGDCRTTLLFGGGN
ncbi:4Fe-4S dicluster domain-containing protein [Halosegnis marinus]|uniref:4Fe-4S dicluster domain-containing protein n=1 Tax=Halosegnis marinus TaxID=3034023 RepID=A0ABD5ZT89_9EURY|nr:hydrogenase iron-sulfur subunit [Halosegnis sp. DT85]